MTRSVRILVVAAFSLLVGSFACLTFLAGPSQAATKETGFVLDSGVDEVLGGGIVITGDSPTISGQLTASGYYQVNGNDIFGKPWSLGFRSTSQPSLPVGSYTSNISLSIKQGTKLCTALHGSFDVVEAPAVNASGSITAFGIEFRTDCFAGGSIHGSVRIGSALPLSLLHVTSKITFADTVEGTTSAVRLIEVANVGETIIDLDPATLTGPDLGQFSIDDRCAGATLGEDGDCLIRVTFTPAATTTKMATVVLPNDAVDGTRNTVLSGYGLSTLTLLPSALVFDSRDHDPVGKTDQYNDPAFPSVGGAYNNVSVVLNDWTVRIDAPHDQGIEPGTYPATLNPTYSTMGLWVSRGGSKCGPGNDPIAASVTILQPLVIDSDGRILQFAADFEQHCVDGPGTLRGWVRFHSEIPFPKYVSPALDLSLSETTARVGDTITLTPTPRGVDFYDFQRCRMAIRWDGPLEDSAWMEASSDDCAPWTFTLPPTALGHYSVDGYLAYSDSPAGAQHLTHIQTDGLVVVAGGGHVPYASNYPVASWSTEDTFSDQSPAYGSPQTFRAPPGADSCRLMMVNGGLGSWVQQTQSCTPWTFTMAASDPVTGFYLPHDGFSAIAWSGATSWTIDEPELGYLGARSGKTYRGVITPMSGAGGTFDSDLPAIFAPASRLSVGYVDDPTPAPWAPIVVGTSEGSCQDESSKVVQVVSGGGCGTFVVPDWEFTSGGTWSDTIILRDLDGNEIARTSYELGYALHMAPLSISVEPDLQPGDDLDVGASTATGLPSGYSITVSTAEEQVADFSGSFPVPAGQNGGAVDVTADSLPTGHYAVDVTFSDIKGETRTASALVDIEDTLAPTGTVEIDGGAKYATSTSVSVGVPATDPSGVSQVALSNDGVTWTTFAYATPLPWTLPAGEGLRSVRAKWRDGVGNWSLPRSDSIVLDMVDPVVTSISRSIANGASFTTSSVLIHVAWTGLDAGSGIDHYDLDESIDGAAWAASVDHPSVAYSDQRVGIGHTYRYRVRAVDKVGHVGAWSEGSVFRLDRREDRSHKVSYTGSWKRLTKTIYSGGTAKQAKAAGAVATLKASMSTIGIVSRVGPTMGKATVYVNGKKVASIDLHASSVAGPRVVWSRSWSNSALRRISIRVSGTHSHPKVVLDAFVMSA